MKIKIIPYRKTTPINGIYYNGLATFAVSLGCRSVVRMEDTRLPKCVMFGELVGGAVSSGGQEKEWMGCLLGDFRAFGIKTGQWTIEAQDEGE